MWCSNALFYAGAVVDLKRAAVLSVPSPIARAPCASLTWEIVVRNAERDKMAARTPLYSVVLAAGKGRRMRNQVFHKVCFQIAGVPAIHRALDAYNRIGVVRNVVVVGDLAGQVVETVGKQFRNVVFAFRPDARGTGDAARCGLQALSEIDPDARILIVAGDKIIENAALTRLVRRAEEMDADLAVLVTPAEWAG